MLEYEVKLLEEAIIYVGSGCRSWKPAKTIFVFAPEDDACLIPRLRVFARKSGWLDAIEKDEAVLVLPTAYNGWANENVDLLPKLYRYTSKNSRQLVPGEERQSVWCWETMTHETQ